jgi:hypothetical protein
MDRKLASILALLIVLIVIVPVAISAEISVGVKQGDWIEYQVTFTGTPAEEHNVVWAKMEISAVQGKSINLDMTVNFSDGTQKPETSTLNLEAGQLGDDFIIPANLNAGDTFYDKTEGNIMISGAEERTYAGATRTVVYANTSQTKFYWDKSTGILVEATSSYTEPEYTMHTTADKTNMWQAQTDNTNGLQTQIFGLDSTLFYALIIVAVAIIATIIFFVIRKKK